MNKDNLQDQVCAVVARTFEVDRDKVTLDLSHGQLQAWDSMGHLNLMMELERTFSVRFSTQQIAQLRSVSEIVSALAKETKR